MSFVCLLSSPFQQQEWLLNCSRAISACVPWSGVFKSVLKMGLTSCSLTRGRSSWAVFCSVPLQNSGWAVFRSKVHLSFHTNQPAQNGKGLGAARPWTGCSLQITHRDWALPASLLWDVSRGQSAGGSCSFRLWSGFVVCQMRSCFVFYGKQCVHTLPSWLLHKSTESFGFILSLKCFCG